MGEEITEDIVAPIIDSIKYKDLDKYKSSFKIPRIFLIINWLFAFAAILVNWLLPNQVGIKSAFNKYITFSIHDIFSIVPFAYFVFYLLSFKKPFLAFLLATILMVGMFVLNIINVPEKVLSFNGILVIVCLYYMIRAVIYSYRYEQLVNS